ncbi:ABC transporter permease [Paenibacillus aceti]|uniref:ABC transporter permease n=1 Tax=Paenibacillus aceti TaxID=1820010 RepID=A0ABQ1VTX1_9BACL|nr:ABC transporter permease [Paenibacillus aceti]GGF98881.1 ABC transporter permease [Paenibacillus aceti]
MNIVNKLTIRHMRLNKRRTWVTIIGVIISVAMITAVATISASFLDLLKQHSIATDGEWHVRYHDVDARQIEAIQQDSKTKGLSISRNLGYAYLENPEISNKPYLLVREYSDFAFQQLNIKLADGRLPKNKQEIVVPQHITRIGGTDYQIGDTISLSVGQRHSLVEDIPSETLENYSFLLTEEGEPGEELINLTEHKYTIVGMIETPKWERSWGASYTAISYIDKDMLGVNDVANATVTLHNVNKSIYKHAEQLTETIGATKNQLEYNSALLRYYGITNNNNLNKLLYSLTAIMMGIVIVGSVALIYNAFAISVAERSRHLGMLSSVGATRRQKRNSVLFEGAVIGLISIPLGIASGLAGIGITFLVINSVIQKALDLSENLKVSVTVTPFSMITAILVSVFTIFISAYLPARRAAKVTAIEAIRQTAEIKLTGKTVKTSKLVRKVFGLEAEIGLKNLKRNKRKYQATVFSLVISIVLFLAVSYFTNNMKRSVEMTQSGANYDIQLVSIYGKMDPHFAQSVAELNGIQQYSLVKRSTWSTWIDPAVAAYPLKEMVKQDKSILENGKIQYYVHMYALDRQSLEAYAAEIGANSEELNDPKQMKAIVIDQASYLDDVHKKFVETKTLYSKIGDDLELISDQVDSEQKAMKAQVEIAALTAQRPLGIDTSSLSELSIIVSEPVMNQLLAGDGGEARYSRNSIFLKSTDPIRTERDILSLKEAESYYLWNLYSDKQRDAQTITLLSVFTYGFILLITAISVANIFNTISTSISLRKREFAMLRSVGMTPHGFNKMINYESIFYGIKSLLYGLPLSFGVMLLIYYSLSNSFSYRFDVPWISLVIVIIGVFVIVGSAMLYSSSKVKKENIIEAIKQENI